MHEDYAAEFFGFFPEGIELVGGEFVAVDVASDGGAAEVVFFDAFFELLGGQVGILQGYRGEGDEAVRDISRTAPLVFRFGV